MTEGSVLRRLGFAANDRAVIVHVDDLGMCQAGLSAFADLVESGFVSSGSVMVPCPWFPEAAAFCRAHPEVDVGVHATLTSEWDGCRWGPVSTRDPSSGLLDEEGFFPRRREQVRQAADPRAVGAELRAQLDRARRAGIDATHLDSHMFVVFDPRLLAVYCEAALAAGTPPLLCRGEPALRWFGADPDGPLRRCIGEWEERGAPLVDHLAYLPLDEPEERLARVEHLLAGLPPGLTHLIIHPARDTPELRAMTSRWRCRVADYEAFLAPELRRHARNLGIAMLDYRPLRELAGEARR